MNECALDEMYASTCDLPPKPSLLQEMTRRRASAKYTKHARAPADLERMHRTAPTAGG